MDSKIIVDKYKAKLDGQQRLFENHDIVLRKTPFQSIDDDFDKKALVHWWMNVYLPEYHNADEQTPSDIHRIWHNALRQHFRYCKAAASYNPMTNQQTVRLSCYKNDPLVDHLVDFKLWLPHVKLRNNNGRKGKYFGVFEKTLSKHGIYSVWVWSDNDIDLEFTRYGNTQVIQHFSDTEDMMIYIKNKHYYEEKYES